MNTMTMASKNLTHIFMIMRDKAIQRRTVFQTRDEMYSDREALIDDNMEMGMCSIMVSKQPPDWTYQVEEIKYNIEALQEKTRKLVALQTNLLRRPSLDDNTVEERQLADLAAEIKMALERCQSLMLQVKQNRCTGREHLLNKNVVRALANSLQNIKNEFVAACNTYTSTINSLKKTSSFLHDSTEYDSDYGTFEEESNSQQRSKWTEEQLLFLEDNSLMVEERDKAVQNILKSTLELNQIFKDVAYLVHEQGTIVDQIDFNIETTSHQVHEGAVQLKKAERSQRKDKKMTCIIGLAGAIIFFLLLLVVFKS